MTYSTPFTQLLETYIQRDGRHVRQLSQATAERFGQSQQVAHNTISRWRRGEVTRPRNWPDLVKLAIVLQLSLAEANQLLGAAGHGPIAGLRQQTQDPAEREWLSHWDQPDTPNQPPFQAPPRLPTFTGRHAEINRIKKALRGADRFCCLQGMPGVGKTTLATHLAYELRPHFPDGVLWLRLDRSEAMPALQGIAAAYGQDVSHYVDLGSRSAKVRELLAHKQALLVLDNAVDDQTTRPLLPPTGVCAVLMTTRRHDLAIADQAQRFIIEPFSQEKKESLALFSQILGQARSAGEETSRAGVADLLGHLPLAIDIAANRIKHEPAWTTADFLARLQQEQQRLALLSRGDQAIRLSFACSYHALSGDDRQLFAALGVFAGIDFSPAAAAAVANIPLLDAEDGLRRLHNLSLAQPGLSPGRYQLHPLLRDYSREQGDQAALALRLVNYFVDFIAAHGHDHLALDAEVSNVLAALRLAHELGLAAEVVQAANALYPYLQARGLFDQAQRLLDWAQQAARDHNDPAGLILALHNLGRVALKQGHAGQAEAHYDEALVLARQLGDAGHVSNLLTKLGALAHRRGHFSQARDYYDEAMALAEQAGDTYRIAALHTNLGLLAAVQGDYTAAESSYRQALPLARRAEDQALVVTVLQNLGDLLEQRGDYAQAGAHYQQGFALARRLGNAELISRMLGNLGLVACALRNYAEAAAYFRQGLAQAEQSGLALQICRQQANLGYVATLRRDYTGAATHYREALALARRLDFPEDIAVILNQWAAALLEQQQIAEAAEMYREALAIAGAANVQREAARSLFGQAQIACRRGNVAEARRLGQESQQRFAAMGHKKASDVQWWLAELPRELEEG